MAQKIIVGILFLTIIGAGVIGVYDATRATVAEESADTITNEAVDMTDISEAPVTTTSENTANDPVAVSPLQAQQQSQNMVGEPWSDTGVITVLDDFGMTLETEAAGSIYVELGPPTYWQAQGVELAVEDQVTVEGFANGDLYHAAIVTTADGTQLALRQDTGHPLWAGNAGIGSGSGGQSGAETTIAVAPEEWVTLTGTISSITNGTLSLQTDEGLVAAKLGQPGFWQSQGVTLTAGDAVDIIGFWQNDAFQAGDIVKLETNERIMLRDPNGRQLWGGPGRNGSGGQGGGNGNGGQGGGNGNGGHNGGQGQGNGGGQGQGNGYRGGQN